MVDRWIMVRLDRATHDALCGVRSRMLRGVENSQRRMPQDNRDRTSLSATVDALIAAYCQHLDRAKKKRQKDAAAKRSKRREATAAGTEVE